MDKLKTTIESVFLDLIKRVGDSEHIYYGMPAEMINKLVTRIKADKDIKHSLWGDIMKLVYKSEAIKDPNINLVNDLKETMFWLESYDDGCWR